MAGRVWVECAQNAFRAARLLLKRAFREPVCHEYAALAEYLDAAGELPHWREVAAEFRLSARGIFELAGAIFSLHEKRGRPRDAFALVDAMPQLVSATGNRLPGQAGISGVDGARLRRLAMQTGELERCEQLMTRLASLRVPGIGAEREALLGEWSARRGDAGGHARHFERAVALQPGRWEFVRSLAQTQLRAGKGEIARAALERFLAVSHVAAEREEAFDWWKKAGSVAGK